MKFPEPAPDAFVAAHRRITGKLSNSVGMRDILDAGIVQIDVDPHAAILSMPNIIKSMSPIMDRFHVPTFLHNKTDVDFISSDNPVCYFSAGSDLDSIVPYAAGKSDDFELIFPITTRVALCVDSRRKTSAPHRDTYSRRTVTRINSVIALFADRYVFNRGGNIEALVSNYSDRGPIPDLEQSIVGNGFVQQINYKIGKPSAFSNTWEYTFRR